MTARPWMPLYVADYLADTSHLSAAESGAYLHLIMHYWLNEGLPTDDRLLARITKLSPTQWKAVRPVIQEFFSDGWKHKRIEFELTQTARISAAGRAGGVASGEARRRAKEERTTNGSANDRSTNGEALHSPSQLQEKEKKETISSLRSDWPDDFREQFWSKYPKKTGKAGAIRKLESVRKAGKVKFPALLSAVVKYAQIADPQYTKNPETWLSKGCWDDEVGQLRLHTEQEIDPRL